MGDKQYGRDLEFVNEEEYSFRIVELENLAESKPHRHAVKKQTFLILGGSVTIDIEGSALDYGPGEQVTVLPGRTHNFKVSASSEKAYLSFNKALILEIATHHED